jgi:outer membrane lipoprotein-sorting protein
MKNIFLALFLFISFAGIKAQDARAVLNDMLKNVSAGKTYEYTMIQNERINGVMHRNKIYTKLNVKPIKVFLDNIEGANKGTQVLYVQGQNSDKVLVNVLWGVSLSPFNSKIRKDQHHTILDSGFGILVNTLKDAVKRADAEKEFNTVFKIEGEVTYDGRKCYKMTINDPTFTYVNYTIKNGESLYDIAIRENVSEQLIVEKNSSLKGFDSAKDGMKILIPSSYAKKTILYIDKQNLHPIYQEMHDDKGLFEKYEFLGLKVNPKFADNEFDKNFPGYKF